MVELLSRPLSISQSSDVDENTKISPQTQTTKKLRKVLPRRCINKLVLAVGFENPLSPKQDSAARSFLNVSSALFVCSDWIFKLRSAEELEQKKGKEKLLLSFHFPAVF